MPSSISWLDGSRAEQQQVRELLRLGRDSESRDELGIGQARDAFSDRLFPGTSTLHTRARYLLIVPWCHEYAARQNSRVSVAERVDRIERRLIGTLLRQGKPEGMHGARTGPHVKALPTALYWGALRQYGIRLSEGFPQMDVGDLDADRESGEVADRAVREWCSHPPAPLGFPDALEGGLDLTRREAQWLDERIRVSTKGRLLEHFLSSEIPPSRNSWAPWDDPASLNAPPAAAADLRHAEAFSLGMHGAALLYNLVIAHRYVAAGHTKREKPVETFQERLRNWADLVDGRVAPWPARQDMWARLIETNPRINHNSQSRHFIDYWLNAVVDGTASAMARLPDPARHPLAAAVAKREGQIKGVQSRLTHPTLLREWSGSSGDDRLTYRWRQVRGVLADICDGREREDAPGEDDDAPT